MKVAGLQIPHKADWELYRVLHENEDHESGI